MIRARASVTATIAGTTTLAVTAAAGMLVASTANAAVIPAPEAYQLHCSGCHGPDGSGDDRIVPSLREIGPLMLVDGGREYLARVPGVAQAPLPSDELATLLNYILRQFAGVESPVPFTAEEIARLRASPLRDPIAGRPRTP
jgi:mono/diheme cytochrome c family protein